MDKTTFLPALLQAQVLLQVQVLQQVLILLHQANRQLLLQANQLLPLCLGTINEIKVKVGDKVNTGDTVVVLEAMKMQNNIDAETSGTITSINVNKGDAVMEGDTLVTIA